MNDSDKIIIIAKKTFFLADVHLKAENDQCQLPEAVQRNRNIPKVHINCFNIPEKGAERSYLDNDMDTERKSQKEGK